MTTYPPNPSITQPVPPASRRPVKKTLLIPGYIVVSVVLLGIGYGIGAGSSVTTQSELTKARHELAGMRSQLGMTKTKLATAHSDLATARSAAANAARLAAKKYAADEARLAAREKKLAADERAVKALKGQVLSSTISDDGVYVVGRDIKAGTWHTSGGSQCYYATLNSTNTSDISDNNNFDGPETVNADGVVAFQISGGCNWVRIGS